MTDNRHFDRLFHNIVRTGFTDEIDNLIHMCESNAGVASNPSAWLERANEYRKVKEESRLQRATLLARGNDDEFTQ